MDKPFFSIAVVTLNAEANITETIKSILSQTCTDYEIVVKDGDSRDNTLELIPQLNNIRIFKRNDSSVYDGMNQAISETRGSFIIFMNAGDSFCGIGVLDAVKMYSKQQGLKQNCVIYGDYFNADALVIQDKKYSDFSYFRKPICHQTMFYSRELFDKYGEYNIAYKISADYELIGRLKKANVSFVHIDIPICRYQGGGISETSKGKKTAVKEKKSIVGIYFSKWKRIKYSTVIMLTFPQLRGWIVSEKSPRWIRNIYRRSRNYFAEK